MGRIALVSRLVLRDLQRRLFPALLLLLVITAAMATLTLSLILHGVTSKPYAQTRAATAGPDVVASNIGFTRRQQRDLHDLGHRAGRTALLGHSAFLGATPQQTVAGLSAAQLLPALAGALLGIPAGTALYGAVQSGGPQGSPPTWWLLTMVLGMLLAVAGLTAIPAHIGARRPVAEILQAELA